MDSDEEQSEQAASDAPEEESEQSSDAEEQSNHDSDSEDSEAAHARESAKAKEDDFYPLSELPPLPCVKLHETALGVKVKLSDREHEQMKAADKRKQFEKVVGLFENVGKTEANGLWCKRSINPASKYLSPTDWEDNILDLVKTFDCDLLNVVTRKHGSLLNLAAKHNAPRLCDYLLTERGTDFFEFSARDEHGRTAIG
eukprot:g7755.t1